MFYKIWSVIQITSFKYVLFYQQDIQYIPAHLNFPLRVETQELHKVQNVWFLCFLSIQATVFFVLLLILIVSQNNTTTHFITYKKTLPSLGM